MAYCDTSGSSTRVLPTSWRGSTHLNSTIQTYSDVANRIKAKLGAPRTTIETTDEQMCMFIDEALEWYTKYAGQTLEYLLVCTSQYEHGCGFKLDDFVNYDCGPRQCISTTTFDVVTSVASVSADIATTTSLLSTQVVGNSSIISLTYDPDNVWQFNPCLANTVTITSTTATPADVSLCGPVTGLFGVTNGIVTIYPENYAALAADACTALTAYWGCDITDATHVIITNVPPCTIGGLNSIVTNNGKIVTTSVCNTAINTGGPMPATFEFVTSYAAPSAVYGQYDITNNTNYFKVNIPYAGCLPKTSTWTYVDAIFSSMTSTSAYATSSCETSAYFDHDIMMSRKVVDVTSLDRNGTFGGIGETYLYGLDYAIAQNLWGGTALTVNVASRGFDFVTYELLGQYMDLAKRMLAREYEFRFNRDTQRLKIIPEPPYSSTGTNCVSGCSNICFIITCYVEKPIAHLLKERWVMNYAMALTMISLGHTRTKYGQVTLFGGGSLNGTDIMSQGLELKEKLENELMNGFGEVLPPRFFVG